MRQRCFFWILGVLAWGWLGACAPMAEMPEISIRVGQLQDNVKGVTLWLLSPDYAGGAPISCQALLDRTVSFDAVTFNQKKAKSAILAFSEQDSISSTIDGITPGNYLFVVGGYKNNLQEPSNLRYIGCQEGKVELGKKLVLSIFLAMVPIPKP